MGIILLTAGVNTLVFAILARHAPDPRMVAAILVLLATANLLALERIVESEIDYRARY